MKDRGAENARACVPWNCHFFRISYLEFHYLCNKLSYVFSTTITERGLKMKRLVVGLTLIVACVVFVGCASVPQFTNLTGQWNYQFTESGKNEVQTGSMNLKQDCFKLTGQANDAYGEFALTGTVEGSDFTINGIKNDQKRSFKMSAKLEDENSFNGKYTTDQKTSGQMTGTRIVPK
jgi:hypothetical protein